MVYITYIPLAEGPQPYSAKLAPGKMQPMICVNGPFSIWDRGIYSYFIFGSGFILAHNQEKFILFWCISVLSQNKVNFREGETTCFEKMFEVFLLCLLFSFGGTMRQPRCKVLEIFVQKFH